MCNPNNASDYTVDTTVFAGLMPADCAFQWIWVGRPTSSDILIAPSACSSMPKCAVGRGRGAYTPDLLQHAGASCIRVGGLHAFDPGYLAASAYSCQCLSLCRADLCAWFLRDRNRHEKRAAEANLSSRIYAFG